MHPLFGGNTTPIFLSLLSVLYAVIIVVLRFATTLVTLWLTGQL